MSKTVPLPSPAETPGPERAERTTDDDAGSTTRATRDTRGGRRAERRAARAAAWREPRRRGWGRLLLAVAGGACVGLSFQPYALWPLLFLGVAALTVAAYGARPRRAFGLGFVFGVVMLTLTIGWIHVLGLPVAIVLVAFEALFFALLGLGLSLITRLRWWPVGAAAAWVLVEYGYSRIPFGGFGWTRIGYAVVDTPLAGFLPFVGVAGVSFLAAATAQLLAWLVVRPRRRRARSGLGLPARIGIAVLAWVVVFGAGLPLRGWQPTATGQGSVNVAIVQGNVPGRGIEALGRARTVTVNHLSQTADLVTQVRLGRQPQPDFILWPENSTDIDPTLDAQTRIVVNAAAAIAGVPVMVGAVMEGPGRDERQTSALWWQPDGAVAARYDKRNLVPFGEWIPFRDQLLPLLPILKLVGAQSIPGTRPGVLRVPLQTSTGRQQVGVGDVICFELAYDATVHQAITSGAQLMMVQSNNATYGGTGQIEQQFAITRARAMETRRDFAVATTNSVSGFIHADGQVVWRSDQFTHTDQVVTMPLQNAITPAVRYGGWIDAALAVLAGLFVLAGAFVPGRAGRRPAAGGSARK